MKRLIILGVFISGLSLVNAQERIPFDSNDKRPVLNENIRQSDLLRLKPQLLERASQNDIVSDLTPEQKSKISDLILERDKQLLQAKNMLAEKEARLKTLESSDDVNMKSINKTIDEIGALIIKQMKTKAEYKQKIRQILTEKQRVEFDLTDDESI